MTDYVSEKETPSAYNLSYDDENIPQRELTDFVVTTADHKISICSLDDRRPTDGPVIARGSVLANGKSLRVVTAPLIEWCIEYGNTPHLWVRSAAVWYRLTKPAKEYSRTHELARRRFELCSRIFILGTTMSPKETTYAMITSLLQAPYLKMKGYSERELLSEKEFILAQVKNLNDPALAAMTFIKELRDKQPGTGKKSSLTKKNSSGSLSIGSAAAPSYLGAWVPSGNLDREGNARLLKRAEKALNQIYKQKNAWPFREPVNPKTDGCPDYLERIQTPMDYGTIKAKFTKGEYSNALDAAKDVRQVAANCCEYNGNSHEFAIWATDLEQKFENLLRGGEDAELAAMKKRVASKKRKASDLPPSGKGSGKKAAKIARKDSKASSLDVSPSRDSSTKDTESSSGQRQCARTNPQVCEKFQVAGSKYCSDECGLIVARKRVAEMSKAGYSVEEYVKSCLRKALIHGRS